MGEMNYYLEEGYSWFYICDDWYDGYVPVRETSCDGGASISEEGVVLEDLGKP
jgi:hypothetical protein